MSQSKASVVASWPEARRATWLAKLSREEAGALRWSWAFWGRPEQHAPKGDWRTWLLLAGRGFGKTRAGAEWVNEQALAQAGCRIALLGRTAADVRDVMITHGVLVVGDPDKRPTYEPSKRRLTWPNGSMATCFSAEEPDQMRGPQYHRSWIDELAAFQYTDAYDQLQLGLRLGDRPRCVITTTPRPTPIIRLLLADPHTVITRGTTFDNSENISIDAIVARYGGTTLGRQELYAEILDDAPGAMWKRSDLDLYRVKEAPELRRIVIGVDPAVTSGEDSDETGIVAVGIDRRGHLYTLEDVSGRLSPDAWARRVASLYHRIGADCVVAEVNQGGDLVDHTIRTVDPKVHVKKVHASRGKHIRAEPVAAMSEQGRAHHVGVLAVLEDQQVTWQPGVDKRSPDRVDAYVHACNDLLASQPVTGFRVPGVAKPSWRRDA